MADLTYAELRSTIANRLNRDDLSSEIATVVQEVIEDYSKELFYPSETEDTTAVLLTTTNTRIYSLASITPRWQNIKEVHVFSGNWILLTKKLNDEMNEMDVNSPALSSLPSYWCIFGGSLRIFPCGPGYNLRLTLNKGPAAPVADADVTFWSTDAQTLIIAAACERLANEYLKDPERTALHRGLRQTQEIAMNSKTIRLMGGMRFKGYL
jgi:hypothetical protein